MTEIADKLPDELRTWGLNGLHDSVVVDRTAQAIAEVLDWRGVTSDRVQPQEIVKLVLNTLLYLEETMETTQRMPIDQEEVAFMREYVRRVGKD